MSHITSFGHLRWLRSIDYESAWIHAKSESKSKSKWKSKSKANPIGRQFEGKLSFSFSFCPTVSPLAPRPLLNPRGHYEVGTSFLLDLSSELCKEREGGGGDLNTHWLCFISKCFAITFLAVVVVVVVAVAVAVAAVCSCTRWWNVLCRTHLFAGCWGCTCVAFVGSR